MTPDKLARLFHETYEELAPDFGYETRPESAVRWESVPKNNRMLMVAVATVVLNVLERDGELSNAEFSSGMRAAQQAQDETVAGQWDE